MNKVGFLLGMILVVLVAIYYVGFSSASDGRLAYDVASNGEIPHYTSGRVRMSLPAPTRNGSQLRLSGYTPANLSGGLSRSSSSYAAAKMKRLSSNKAIPQPTKSARSVKSVNSAPLYVSNRVEQVSMPDVAYEVRNVPQGQRVEHVYHANVMPASASASSSVSQKAAGTAPIQQSSMQRITGENLNDNVKAISSTDTRTGNIMLPNQPNSDGVTDANRLPVGDGMGVILLLSGLFGLNIRRKRKS